MEPLAHQARLAVRVATPDSVDIAELAAVAAHAFPLACPRTAPRANITAFVEANLSTTRFTEYLADPQRVILTASHDDRVVGYAMLIRGVGDNPDVQRAVRVRPAVELSKMYVLPDNHGGGVSTALMDAALAAAAEWRAPVAYGWVSIRKTDARSSFITSAALLSAARRRSS